VSAHPEPADGRERGGHLIEVNLYESELTPFCAVSLRGAAATVLPCLVERLATLRSS